MSLKSELSQLQTRYPKLTKIFKIIFYLWVIGVLYEFGKILGKDIYHLIH